MPNPVLIGPGTKIDVRQCHHSNQRIRCYTNQTTLGFYFPILGCTPTSTCRPNVRPFLPPPRLPVQTDPRRPRPSEAGTVLTARTLSAPRGGGSLMIRPDTGPIRNICCQTNFALYIQGTWVTPIWVTFRETCISETLYGTSARAHVQMYPTRNLGVHLQYASLLGL